MWLILALLPTVGLVGGAFAMPVLVGRITIDATRITVHVEGMRLSLAWKDVRAVQVTRQQREPYLVLGVGSGLYVLPVGLFPVEAMWQAIVKAAPAPAVQPDALAHYERKDANEGLPPDLWMIGTLHVADHRGLTLAGVFGMAGFLLLFLIAVLTGQPGGPVYLAFSALYLLALTAVGVTELDMAGVTRRTLLGTSRITWDELSAFEMGPFGLRVVLEGNLRRRMVLFGPAMWTGPDAARAAHFLALQISTRRLTRKRSLLALFKFSRNTRLM